MHSGMKPCWACTLRLCPMGRPWRSPERCPGGFSGKTLHEIGFQYPGQSDAAIGLLIVLHHGHQRAAHGQAGAVQGMGQPGPAAVLRLATDAGAAGLKVGAVGAGRDLPVAVLAGQPDFDVIGLGRGKAQVCCAERNHTVGQFQKLQRLFGVGEQAFQLGKGLLRRADLDQLHLFELVLTDEAAGVLAVGAPSKLMTVVFPLPDNPTNAVVVLSGILKEIPLRTGVLS